MASPAHATYAMSSAATWLECTASAGLCASVPPMPDEEYSLEGTAAHKLLELCLDLGLYDAKLVHEETTEVEIPNHAMLKPDVVEAVQACLDYVDSLRELDPAAKVRSESRVYFEPRPGLCYGTCDIIVELPTLNAVYIIDFKAGAGKLVEVEENDQALGYGVAAITTHGLRRDAYFTLCIVQPRFHHKHGPVREWAVSIDRLDMQRDLMLAAIEDGEGENPSYSPSAERCRWCSACAACKVAEAEGLKPFGITSYKQADSLHLPDVETLDPARLAYMLSALELLKAYGRNAYARAFSLAKAGVYIPGFKLVESRAERKYEYDSATTIALVEGMTNGELPLDEIAPREVLPITVLEVKIKRWAREKHSGRTAKNKASQEITEEIAMLTTKQSSGNLSLVPDTDKRHSAPVTNGLSRIVAPPTL